MDFEDLKTKLSEQGHKLGGEQEDALKLTHAMVGLSIEAAMKPIAEKLEAVPSAEKITEQIKELATEAVKAHAPSGEPKDEPGKGGKKDEGKDDPVAARIAELRGEIDQLKQSSASKERQEAADRLARAIVKEKAPRAKSADALVARVRATLLSGDGEINAEAAGTALNAELEYLKALGTDTKPFTGQPSGEGGGSGATGDVEQARKERLEQIKGR